MRARIWGTFGMPTVFTGQERFPRVAYWRPGGHAMLPILIGLISSGMLAVGVEAPWPVGGFANGLWDLVAVAGVIVSIGLLESV